MPTIEEFNALGHELERLLILRYSPIAMKLIYSEEEIPEGSMRPYKDKGGHLAMCQAFAMVRRERKAITMLKEDHWCVWPLVSYGLIDLDEDDYEYMGTKFFFADDRRSVKFLREEYPMLNAEKKPIGFTLAPLRSCNFVPDIVCTYCRPAQIRSIMMAMKFKTGEMLNVTLDPVDSCVHSTIPVLKGKDFNITFPDPGEYERALCDEDEVMFTMRSEKVSDIVEVLKLLSNVNFGYQEMAMGIQYDTPRPEFYNVMFDKWGLQTGEQWEKS
jgi:uncharacterized protein (DUF169 family)